MLEISPFSIERAIFFCKQRGQEVALPIAKEAFAICIERKQENPGGLSVTEVLGVIIMDRHEPYAMKLHHLYTDATSQVGTLLYGAAWRAAKALGYKQITL